MPSYLQRKYIDLISQVCSKWVNWDPPIEIRVGAYGSIDEETGDLRVEGNVYDSEFQAELDKHGVDMNMADFLPQEGPVEDDFIVASRGAKRCHLSVDQLEEVDIADITTDASVKRQWLFKRGKRDAILMMHRPRQIILPPKAVLESLYRVDKLIDKWLVTTIHVCPAYSMYLSDKSGDRVSLALVSQAPITEVDGVAANANGGFTCSVDARTCLLRNACDTAGDYVYTPLFEVKSPIGRIRKDYWDSFEPEPLGDDLWYTPCPPWDPLDEDGEEDPIDVSMQDIEPFDPSVGLVTQSRRPIYPMDLIITSKSF